MLEINNLYKAFEGFQLKNISFKVEKGDYFVILGLSGAGKSLLLELIAGVEKPDCGSIYLKDKNIVSEKIQNRNIGLIYQDLALFPHLSVKKNISYSLHNQNLSKEKIEKKISELSKKLAIDHLLKRYPSTLSGGEQQRVALARILMKQPEILLLDEPLSSLDIQLKNEIRFLFRQLNRNGQTIIHVTHDFEEAISLANKIAVIDQGELIQTGTPEAVFQYPKTAFIANFTGIKNFFKCKITSHIENNKYVLVDDKIGFHIVAQTSNSEGYIMFGNNDVIISNIPPVTSATNVYNGQISDILQSRYGIEILIDIGINIHALITQKSLEQLDLYIGKQIWLCLKATVIKFVEH